MERSILTVEPVAHGWVVKLKGKAVVIRATKIEAIGAASDRAARRHVMSGGPTGVSVRVGTGETVLIARHGWAGQKSRGSFR
jgi:hypothetical protein